MSTVGELLDGKGGDTHRMSGDDSVLEAARLMKRLGIGGMIVLDGKQIGMCTERDILQRVVAEERDPATTKLRDVMTSPVISCSPIATLDECLRTMYQNKIRHLPIIDGNELCGLVTNRDIDGYIRNGATWKV